MPALRTPTARVKRPGATQGQEDAPEEQGVHHKVSPGAEKRVAVLQRQQEQARSACSESRPQPDCQHDGEGRSQGKQEAFHLQRAAQCVKRPVATLSPDSRNPGCAGEQALIGIVRTKRQRPKTEIPQQKKPKTHSEEGERPAIDREHLPRLGAHHVGERGLHDGDDPTIRKTSCTCPASTLAPRSSEHLSSCQCRHLTVRARGRDGSARWDQCIERDGGEVKNGTSRCNTPATPGTGELCKVVRPEGFEPPTSWFEAKRSNPNELRARRG